MFALFGCDAAPPASPSGSAKQSAPPPASEAEAKAPSNAQPSQGERVFGQGITLEGPALDVLSVLDNPEPHVGKKVKCEGTVARVCERAGCWLELRGKADHEGLRVPMAGHAFFVPQEIVGRRAVVEGELTAIGLSPEARAHLQSEGLKSIGPLSLSATGLVVR